MLVHLIETGKQKLQPGIGKFLAMSFRNSLAGSKIEVSICQTHTLIYTRVPDEPIQRCWRSAGEGFRRPLLNEVLKDTVLGGDFSELLANVGKGTGTDTDTYTHTHSLTHSHSQEPEVQVKIEGGVGGAGGDSLYSTKGERLGSVAWSWT